MFVALHDTRDHDGVVIAVAEAFGVTGRPGLSLLESIESYLAGRQTVFVLDNFEQVLEAAPLVTGLLEAAPDVSVTVTIRAPLRIDGEQE